MNTLPYATGASCPGTGSTLGGYCWGTTQMGGLPDPGSGNDANSPQDYTAGKIHWPSSLTHPVPICSNTP